MPLPVRRLIFVFSAESGSFNAFLDSAKKLLRIKGCVLCSITHGLAGERDDWQSCKAELGVDVDYVHLDEMSEPLRKVVAGRLPCVVAETDEGLKMLLEPEVLERCKGSVADFKGRLFTYAAMYDLELAEDGT